MIYKLVIDEVKNVDTHIIAKIGIYDDKNNFVDGYYVSKIEDNRGKK